MKSIPRIIGILAAISLTAAAIELPRGVYPLADIEAAKQEAAEKKQPLIFIYTDLKTSCGLCIGATEDSFKAFRSRGTMVFIDSKGSEITKAPKSVMKLRMDPAVGKFIPMIMVTTADASKAIKGISYEQLKEGQAMKTARDLRRSLEDADVLGSGTPEVAPSKAAAATDAPQLLAPEQTWQNAEGKSITAAVKEINATDVTFVMPGGKVVSYPLKRLSEESQSKLAELSE